MAIKFKGAVHVAGSVDLSLQLGRLNQSDENRQMVGSLFRRTLASRSLSNTPHIEKGNMLNVVGCGIFTEVSLGFPCSRLLPDSSFCDFAFLCVRVLCFVQFVIGRSRRNPTHWLTPITSSLRCPFFQS